MKIYDCFTFYNELDLLEIRLEELYKHVDRFVIVEANTTFTSKPKPFNFEINIDRFTKYLDKICYVKVVDMPGDKDPWVNEHFQRNQILRGVADADPSDIVVVTDVDEVLRASAVDYMRSSNQTLFALRMPIYNFKFNYIKLNPDRYNIWGMAARRSAFDDILPNTLRDMRFNFFNAPYQYQNDGCEVIEHGGWHFTYMGDNETLKNKAQSFSHQEVNNPEFLAQIDVDASIAARTEWNRSSDAVYEIAEVDSYLPNAIAQNQHKYQQYILANPVVKTLDLLPAYPYNS
jgi:hypothetical protein